MKSGSHPAVEQFDNKGNKLESFNYWVLPDKPMSERVNGAKLASPLSGSWTEWDREATRKQTEQIRNYLSDACTGRWMETSNRFYFELEEDWEMFKTMCLLGWR
jgi:hypothetical protein